MRVKVILYLIALLWSYLSFVAVRDGLMTSLSTSPQGLENRVSNTTLKLPRKSTFMSKPDHRFVPFHTRREACCSQFLAAIFFSDDGYGQRSHREVQPEQTIFVSLTAHSGKRAVVFGLGSRPLSSGFQTSLIAGSVSHGGARWERSGTQARYFYPWALPARIFLSGPLQSAQPIKSSNRHLHNLVIVRLCSSEQIFQIWIFAVASGFSERNCDTSFSHVSCKLQCNVPGRPLTDVCECHR